MNGPFRFQRGGHLDPPRRGRRDLKDGYSFMGPNIANRGRSGRCHQPNAAKDATATDNPSKALPSGRFGRVGMVFVDGANQPRVDVCRRNSNTMPWSATMPKHGAAMPLGVVLISGWSFFTPNRP